MIPRQRVKWSMDMAQVSHSAHVRDRISYHRQRIPRPSPIHSSSSRNLIHITTNCNHWKCKKKRRKYWKSLLSCTWKLFFAESNNNKEENQTQEKKCELSVYRAPKRKIHSWKNLDVVSRRRLRCRFSFPTLSSTWLLRRRRLAPLTLTTVRLEALHNCRRRRLRRLLCVFTFYTFHLFMAKVFDVEIFSSLLFSAAHIFFLLFLGEESFCPKRFQKKSLLIANTCMARRTGFCRFPPKSEWEIYGESGWIWWKLTWKYFNAVYTRERTS